MSILSALKKKFNAKGNNIEEAIKTMEIDGGSSSSSNILVCHYEWSDDEDKFICGKTVQEIKNFINNGGTVIMHDKDSNYRYIAGVTSYGAIRWRTIDFDISSERILGINYTNWIYTDENGIVDNYYSRQFTN